MGTGTARRFEVLVAGAGPGGLRCASILAARGLRVLVLERNRVIGTKVCAGGVTCHGLLNRVPSKLIERSFPNQRVATPLQTIVVKHDEPVVATLNRVRLGSFFAEEARERGAEIITGARLTGIGEGEVSYVHQGRETRVACDYLVGADGAQSKVRSYVGYAPRSFGIGLNYELPLSADSMLWNFSASRFASGYSWLFPHRSTTSAGAYCTSTSCSASLLKKNLDGWLREIGMADDAARFQAGKINIDFRGYRFGRIFLVGDAAGLASPLTGEGIYPAIVSGEAVAKTIIDPTHRSREMLVLIKNHRRHAVMQRLAGSSRLMARILAEVSAFLLQKRWLSFSHFEMA